MRETSADSKIQTAVGIGLSAVGIAVFAVRFPHQGAYAVPGDAPAAGTDRGSSSSCPLPACSIDPA